MKRPHIPNKAWLIFVLLGWSAMLIAGAVSEHHGGGWRHVWRHLTEQSP